MILCTIGLLQHTKHERYAIVTKEYSVSFRANEIDRKKYSIVLTSSERLRSNVSKIKQISTDEMDLSGQCWVTFHHYQVFHVPYSSHKSHAHSLVFFLLERVEHGMSRQSRIVSGLFHFRGEIERCILKLVWFGARDTRNIWHGIVLICDASNNCFVFFTVNFYIQTNNKLAIRVCTPTDTRTHNFIGADRRYSSFAAINQNNNEFFSSCSQCFVGFPSVESREGEALDVSMSLCHSMPADIIQNVLMTR